MSRNARGMFNTGAVALAFMALAACDRGWIYRVPQATPVMADGLRYDLDGPEETRLRVYASVFTVSLSVGLEVWNTSGHPLSIEPQGLSVFRGKEELSSNRPSQVVRCEGRNEERVVLAKGQSCRMRAGFYVPHSARELQDLTLVHRGLVRDERHILVSVSLKKD